VKIARFSHAGTIAFGIIDDDELVVLTGDPMFAGYHPTGARLPLVDVALLAPVIPRGAGRAGGARRAALLPQAQHHRRGTERSHRAARGIRRCAGGG